MDCAEFRSQLQSCPGNAGKAVSLADYVEHRGTCRECREFAHTTLERVTKQLEEGLVLAQARARLMAINANLN